MVNPNINSFAQTPVQGQMDLSFLGSVVTARVSNSQVTALIAGQAVKGDTAAPSTAQDGPPPVLSLASASDPALGFVVRNIKDINAPANARIELAMDGSCMYMTSDAANSGAITRFAPVEYNVTNNTVVAWAGVNPIVGYAYDAAINSGDLIRVLVRSPQLSGSNTSSSIKNATVVATLAQINAGLIIIPGVTGKKITVTSYVAQVTGNFATGTSVELESTNASPVAVTTIAEAGLTTGAVLTPNSANTTLGVGFGGPLGSGDGLKVVNNGTAQTGGTSIQFNVSYTQA